MSNNPFFKDHPEYLQLLLKEYNKRWMRRKRNGLERDGLVQEIADEWAVTPPVITEDEEPEDEEDYTKYLKDRCCACKKRISKSNESYKIRGNYCCDCTREATVNAMSADRRNESAKIFSRVFKH